MKKQFLNFLICGVVLLAGCAKELSFETGGIPSQGSLQSDLAGDCLPKTVNGVYEATKVLVATTNTVVVQVDVTSVGSYDIRSDTVNGYHFRGTGTFTTTGINNVTLNGIGTPFASGINNFVVSYDSTFCDFQVTVLPSGSGGPAVFTLTGTPNCTGATPNGSYGVGIPLTPANTVPIQVNVTTIGTYNISTTFQGMTFQKQGVFTTTGTNTVLLVGSGTPTTAGANTVPLTAGSSTCSFVVNVGSAAQYMIDCPSVFVNGTYSQNVALGGSNTVDLDVNVTTAGVYAISVGPINGMTFTANGTFPSTGLQSITLQGSGTPTNTGTSTFTLPGPTCTFDVIVTPGATIDWKFNVGTTLYQGSTDFADIIPTGSLTGFIYSGSNPSDDISITLADLGGGIQNGETYNSNALTTNNLQFQFFGGASVTYTADFTTSGVNLTVTVITHNTTTKTITGTFAGTVKDGANVTRTITNGTFTGTYP